jgi:hypothetical protein
VHLPGEDFFRDGSGGVAELWGQQAVVGGAQGDDQKAKYKQYFHRINNMHISPKIDFEQH